MCVLCIIAQLEQSTVCLSTPCHHDLGLWVYDSVYWWVSNVHML